MEQAAQQQYRSADLALDSRLSAMYAEAESQRKLLPLYSRELIPQYEATYNASLSSYSVGKTTFAMVIDNLTKLINTKIEYVRTQSSYFSTIAEISRLVGETVTDTGGNR
jgi:outer membrane protein TolC